MHQGLAAWILSRCGLDPDAYRLETTGRRVPACLRRLRVSTSVEAQELLINFPVLLPVALGTVLIGVSSFFREPTIFALLEQELRTAEANGLRRARVFSGGVSTGQELYSIAILLDELGLLEQSELLGVDCRPNAITHAQQGTYDEAELLALTPSQRDRYFPLQNGARTACERLKSRMRWECADLLTYEDIGPRDLILFRNVAIYLRPEALEPIWTRLSQHLVLNGILVTGKGEQPLPSLPLLRTAPSIYRRILSCPID